MGAGQDADFNRDWTNLVELAPIETAVSAMRLEKPHSLSYHDSTRTKLPGITLVCVASNVLEAGL